METPVVDVALPAPLRRSALSGLMQWVAEMVQHAFGDPREEARTQPPAVGVQPYRDRPSQRR